mmetsp:Transcript_33727/g.93155  ORF Transcript_33727/g.93155 Transcript_33727/m.93155 type:complete len:234 (+) Transcript_33727:578-1279(+)
MLRGQPFLALHATTEGRAVYAAEAGADDALATAAADPALREQVPHPAATDRTGARQRGRGRNSGGFMSGLVRLRRLPAEAMAAPRLPVPAVRVLPADHGVATVDLLHQTVALRAYPAVFRLPCLVALELRLAVQRLPQRPLLRRGLPRGPALQALVRLAAALEPRQPPRPQRLHRCAGGVVVVRHGATSSACGRRAARANEPSPLLATAEDDRRTAPGALTSENDDLRLRILL